MNAIRIVFFVLLLTTTHLWGQTPTFPIGVGGGDSNLNYSTTYSAITTKTITGVTHGIARAAIIVSVYDNSSPRKLILPKSATVDGTSFDVVVTFEVPSSGLIVLNGAGDGTGAFLPLAGGTLTGTLNAVDAKFQNTADSTTGFQVLDAAGAPMVVVNTTDGWVGIGTASPELELSVWGPGSPVGSHLGVFAGDNRFGVLYLGDTPGPGNYSLRSSVAGIDTNLYVNAETGGGILFTVNTLPKMVMLASGNFGIGPGNTNPVSTLHVWDKTATVGATTETLQAGEGQGVDDLTQWLNFGGTVLLAVPSAGGLDTTSGTITFADSANVASATVTALPVGNVFHVTGTTTITTLNTCDAANNGRAVYLIFDAILTLTDGSNLKLAGNFVTTADDTLQAVCDGTNWYELSRSVN